jgi:phosphohistidine phosphatase
MNLYLVQHGKAVAKEVDPDRSLTEQGRAEVERVAAFIQPLSLSVGCLWHSGKTRAVQTARILAEVVKADKGVLQRDGLAPNDDVTNLADELNAANQDIMIVGHLPFLSKLASLLISDSESTNVVAFKNGGVVSIRRGGQNQWQLSWIATPGLLS